jgi:hypothetical protein
MVITLRFCVYKVNLTGNGSGGPSGECAVMPFYPLRHSKVFHCFALVTLTSRHKTCTNAGPDPNVGFPHLSPARIFVRTSLWFLSRAKQGSSPLGLLTASALTSVLKTWTWSSAMERRLLQYIGRPTNLRRKFLPPSSPV